MTRCVAILRPEPGNAATAARVRDAGLDPLSLPLFETRPIGWAVPQPAAFDALLLTSANAVRHGGAGLAKLRGLPVLAVGAATAVAALAAGFAVARQGSGGVTELLDSARGFTRLLWLAGDVRTAIEHPALAEVISIYASDPILLSAADAAALRGSVALVHSARAAERLALEAERHGIPRAAVRIAAISRNAADAAGGGWDAVAIAAAPDDEALIDAARPLAIDP